MERWPHQIEAEAKVLAAIDAGERRVALRVATGGGKSLVATDLIEGWADAGLGVALYSNRKMLVEQLHRTLATRGIPHGVRAAGWGGDGEEGVQICSLQTEAGRTRKSAKGGGEWQLHDARRVLVDEGHLHTGPDARAILDRHHAAGAAYVMMTATPIGMAGVCDTLVQAGTMQELRDCGALVWLRHFAPDEPDMRAFKKLRDTADPSAISEADARKAVMTPDIMGRVWTHYQRLNPGRDAALLFASGVRESLWFAQQFSAKGVKAAHVDGDDVWIDGDTYRADQQVRAQVVAGSKDGDIKVVTNRFVLREGVDMPWVRHGIFATIFSSLQSYLQAAGRLLRAWGGLEYKTAQDHGGNWWRWGSPNADREWFLDMTPAMAYGLRAERIRSGKEREPVACPHCGMVVVFGRCRHCGTDCRQAKHSRPVVSTDGTLRDVSGAIFRPRRTAKRDNARLAAEWERMVLYRCRGKGSRTFSAAMALFARENHWQYPDRSWPLMPVEDVDLFRYVEDVPYDRLVTKGEPVHA